MTLPTALPQPDVGTSYPTRDYAVIYNTLRSDGTAPNLDRYLAWTRSPGMVVCTHGFGGPYGLDHIRQAAQVALPVMYTPTRRMLDAHGQPIPYVGQVCDRPATDVKHDIDGIADVFEMAGVTGGLHLDNSPPTVWTENTAQWFGWMQDVIGHAKARELTVVLNGAHDPAYVAPPSEGGLGADAMIPFEGSYDDWVLWGRYHPEWWAWHELMPDRLIAIVHTVPHGKAWDALRLAADRHVGCVWITDWPAGTYAQHLPSLAARTAVELRLPDGLVVPAGGFVPGAYA